MFVIGEADRFWLKQHPSMSIFEINRLASGK
jgi:hypothetical protein